MSVFPPFFHYIEARPSVKQLAVFSKSLDAFIKQMEFWVSCHQRVAWSQLMFPLDFFIFFYYKKAPNNVFVTFWHFWACDLFHVNVLLVQKSGLAQCFSWSQVQKIPEMFSRCSLVVFLLSLLPFWWGSSIFFRRADALNIVLWGHCSPTNIRF